MVGGVVLECVQETLKGLFAVAPKAIVPAQNVQHSIVLNIDLAVILTQLNCLLDVLVLEMQTREQYHCRLYQLVIVSSLDYLLLELARISRRY